MAASPESFCCAKESPNDSRELEVNCGTVARWESIKKPEEASCGMAVEAYETTFVEGSRGEAAAASVLFALAFVGDDEACVVSLGWPGWTMARDVVVEAVGVSGSLCKDAHCTVSVT